MKNLDLIFVVVLFYLGWFGSVFLAKTPLSIASLIFPIALAAFLFFRKSLNKKSIIFVSAVSISGIFFDFALIRTGFIVASGETLLLIPTWLVSIWLLFSFSMVKLGTILSPPVWLAVLMGMIIGPLSYKSGEIFQVLTFSSSITFFIYATFWGIAFPLTLNLSKRFV